MIVLIAFFVAAAVLVAAYAVRMGRRSTVAALDTVGRYGYDTPITRAAERHAERSMALEKAMAALARRLSKDGHEQRLRQRLVQAGMYTTRPSRFLMLRSGGMIFVGLIGLTRAASALNRFVGFCMVVFAPLLGWTLPDVILSGKIRR